MKSSKPKHVAGKPVSPHTYKNHKCRCEDCTKAWAVYCRPRQAKWRKQKKNALV